MDEQLPWMNHFVWATDGDGEPVGDLRARTLTARYYAEITHIDRQIGRLLSALDERGERENTVVAFFADHGELLGDHHAWQKESYFEAATRVPFLVSWPGELPEGEQCDDLVCLTDLFGIATRAAGDVDTRERIDIVGLVRGEAEPRARLVGYYREPGTRHSKLMVRADDWKYVWMANGGREQLFDVAADPDELDERSDDEPAVADRLRDALVE
jgi:choline-sulfatase